MALYKGPPAAHFPLPLLPAVCRASKPGLQKRALQGVKAEAEGLSAMPSLWEEAAPVPARRALRSALISFLRRFFSPGRQRWQKGQSTPLAQPSVCTKAQGLQRPLRWPAEPTEGISGEPSLGFSGEHGEDGDLAGTTLRVDLAALASLAESEEEPVLALGES